MPRPHGQAWDLPVSAPLPAHTDPLPDTQLLVRARRWLCKGPVAAAQDVRISYSVELEEKSQQCGEGHRWQGPTTVRARGSRPIPALTAGSGAGHNSLLPPALAPSVHSLVFFMS